MLSPPISDKGASPARGLRVAVVGGGITGVTLALGLQARGVAYTLYERAPEFREIGAGVGFSPNAEAALHRLDPAVHAAYKRVATANGADYFQWVDGRSTDEVVFKLYLGENGFQGCRRSDFLDELVSMLKPECVRLGKAVVDVNEKGEGGVSITFADGTVEEADVVIGCDGIRSRIRQVLLGESNPAAHPTYTHKYCFRALVPAAAALQTLGPHRVSTRFMYNGPGAHSITYPVADGALLNVLLVLSDPAPWTEPRHTARGRKAEALAAFGAWHPTARAIVDLLPDDMDKWAIFDMYEHPAPAYHGAGGRVCIAGDAAHAVGPHLGAGAGFGMEDALVLAELMDAADRAAAAAGAPATNGDGDGVKSGEKAEKRAELCRKALVAYNNVRYERTQWLAGRTREACDLFQQSYDGVGDDFEKFGKEITWRFHQIWEYDVDEMVRKALGELDIVQGV